MTAARSHSSRKVAVVGVAGGTNLSFGADMARYLSGLIISVLAACSGGGHGNNPTDREGTYFIEWETLDGNCGDIPSSRALARRTTVFTVTPTTIVSGRHECAGTYRITFTRQ